MTAGGRTRFEEVRSGTSYCSQNELVLHFGLGKETKAEKVEIRWPGGEKQVLKDVPGDQLLAVRQASTPP